MDVFGVPLPQAAGLGGGWLVSVSLGTYILRKVITRKLIPEQTHLDIVATVEHDRDEWRTAFNDMAEVNKNNTLINMEWAETSRIIKDYIAARDKADAIEAARRGDQP